ncbi:MAG: multicopper oxidase family protein [Chloroflexi bacterium]|nr:MAG: multicopper oxidase family protein [Chloroflexota bacterium]
MTKVTRRDFLAISAAGMAGMLMTSCRQPVEAPVDTAADFQVLEVKWKSKTLNGLKTKLRSYNDQVPGPLLTAIPGEAMRVRIVNSLTPYDSSNWTGDHNIPHDLNTTNLHVHGLDVAPHLFVPLGTSDPAAPMINVKPGESYDYVFELPADHPPGLYWYHPHKHGSTAVQAVSGMAGPIIIKGDIDEVPEIKAARDIPLAIQDIGLFPSETEADVWTYEPVQNAIWQTIPVKEGDVNYNVTIYDPETKKNVVQPDLKGGFSAGDYAERFYLLNGEPFFQETHSNANPTDPTTTQLEAPQFKMAPGEVVRFRMLNGCSDNLMPIVVEGHEMHLIALDGVNFTALKTIPVYQKTTGDGQVLLAPANRAEFLIKAGTPGRYAIRELEQGQQFLSSSAKTIAEIVVEGPEKDMALPQTLPTPTRYYPLIDKVSRTRTIEFAGTFPPVQNPYIGIDFTINGMLYEEDSVQQEVTLDDAEEWILKVGDQNHGGTEGHPFHIHVNHFEVISIAGVIQPPGTIQDTIWVPKDTEVVIRMKFKDFKGKGVYHCHILPHEDTGMMQNFLIT